MSHCWVSLVTIPARVAIAKIYALNEAIYAQLHRICSFKPLLLGDHQFRGYGGPEKCLFTPNRAECSAIHYTANPLRTMHSRRHLVALWATLVVNSTPGVATIGADASPKLAVATFSEG